MLILKEHKYTQKLMFNSWALSSDFDSLVGLTYNSLISNTSRYQEGQAWHRCYENQICVYGDIYTETVSVGDIVVNDQTFGVAKEVPILYRPTFRKAFLVYRSIKIVWVRIYLCCICHDYSKRN